MNAHVIEIGPRGAKKLKLTKRALFALIQNFAACKVEDSWKGGVDPALVPLIESNLEGALRSLHAFIEKLDI